MMNEIIIYLLIAIIFAVIGLFIGRLLANLKFEKDKGTSEKEKTCPKHQ